MSEIRVLLDAESLAQAAAEIVVQKAQSVLAGRGQFNLVLSGGSTPRRLYQLLAAEPYRDQINWLNVHVFWGDERCVPPDHLDSNYRLAKEALLDHIPLPPENIHRINGELEPIAAAQDYQEELANHFGDAEPSFDLVLLGMGDDGHTASLFPHTSALQETTRWVIANYVSQKQVWRITLSAAAINAASTVMFLVAGADKAIALKDVLQGEHHPQERPSQLIAPRSGDLHWLVDQAAANLLKR